MKKLFNLFALIVLTASVVLPAAGAFALTEQAPVTEPVFVPVQDPPLEPYWNCVYGPGGGSSTCPDPTQSEPTMIFHYAGDYQGGLSQVQIICTTPDCPTLAYYVYVRIDLVITAATSFEGKHNYVFSLAANTPQSSTNYSYEETIVCPQTGGGWSCEYSIYLPIKKAQLSDWNGNPVTITASVYQESNNGYIGYTSMSYDAEFSFIAYSCDERFTIIEPVIEADIDETIEMPLGPDAVAPDSPDNQKVEILGGNFYRLETSGGPWRDDDISTEDYYHTEVSFDEGVTWLELSEIDYVCLEAKVPEPDLMIVYFIAPEGTTSFMIRVGQVGGNPEWSDNTLADEQSPMHYKLDLAEEFVSACSQAFTFGEDDLLTSGTIPATASQGVVVSIPFPSGMLDPNGMPMDFPWIVIETGPGGWLENATERFDALGLWATQPSTFLIGDESEPEPGGLVQCVETINGGGFRVYVQSPNDANLLMMVNDQDNNFANNSGELDYRIYLATYTRPAAACESQFAVGNNRFGGTVSANSENGKMIATLKMPTTAVFQNYELAIGAWYALDTEGGPWRGPGTTHADNFKLQISEGTIAGPLTWEDLDTWANATCVVPLDNIGHIRVYFQVPLTLLGGPDGARAYYLRVDDTNFSNNYGSISYTIRGVTEVSVDPDGNGQCSSYGYDMNTTTAEISIPANAANGVAANPTQLVPDNYYLLHVDGGPWYETENGTPLYPIEISTNNGATWTPALTHAQVLCAEEGNNDYKIFIKPLAGEVWRFRVMSTGFGDNVGGQHISVYPANPDGEIIGTCLAGADLFEMATYVVDAKREDGIVVPLVVGEVYAVEIYSGYWRDDAILGPLSPQSYALDMSVDNGTTWELFHEHSRLDCFQWITRPLLLGSMGRFQPATGDTIRFRVANGTPDTDGNWNNNGGSVTIKIYAVTNADDSNIGDVPAITGLGDACMDMAVRPTSLLDLAGWVMYGFDTFRLYIAWCPRHNAALQSIFSLFGQYEPFATMASFVQFYNTTKTELNSYDWYDENMQRSAIGNSDIQTGTVTDAILSPKPGDNPWMSGQITIRDTSAPRFSTSCNSALKPYIGLQFSDSFCFAGNMMRAVGINLWFQVLVDIMAVLSAIIYIAMRIIKPAIA